MIKPARIIGFAVIALAAFGTAASIAAIGRSDDLVLTRYADLVFAPPAQASTVTTADSGCTVDLLAGGEAGPGLDIKVAEGQAMDLDVPGSAGFTVACGAGAGSTATASR